MPNKFENIVLQCIAYTFLCSYIGIDVLRISTHMYPLLKSVWLHRSWVTSQVVQALEAALEGVADVAVLAAAPVAALVARHPCPHPAAWLKA